MSDETGPESTIWAKPLSGGRTALLAINGADLDHTITIDFGALIAEQQRGAPAAASSREGGGEGARAAWKVRDVWAKADLGTMGNLTRAVGPHDCVLLVLSPA